MTAGQMPAATRRPQDPFACCHGSYCVKIEWFTYYFFFFFTGKIKVERSLAGGLMIMLEAAEFRASSAPGLPPHSLRSPSLIWQLRGLRALPACFSVLPDDI